MERTLTKQSYAGPTLFSVTHLNFNQLKSIYWEECVSDSVLITLLKNKLRSKRDRGRKGEVWVWLRLRWWWRK